MKVCRAPKITLAGYYQYRDRLQSAVIECNEQGQVISYEEYYPYGVSAYRASRSGQDLSLKRYRFTGKERDEETGLDYFGVRYYASWLGRWTSGDPGGFVDGLNIYRYARNNPVNGVDREGYSTEGPGDPPKKDDVPTAQGGNVLADLGMDYLYVGAKDFTDKQAALSIAKGAGLPIEDVRAKMNNSTLWNAFKADRANNRWIFEKPTYKFIGPAPSVLDRNASRFLDGFVDGAEESGGFVIGLIPGTERESWKELAAGTGALIDLSASANSIQLETLSFGLWQASDASHQTVDGFVEQIGSIDYSDPYNWGKFAGSFAVEAATSKFTGAFAKTSKLSRGTKVFHQLGEITEEGQRFINAVESGVLPGRQGRVMWDGYQGEDFARALMEKHSNAEFALLYDSKTKTHSLHSGSIDRLELPAGKNKYLLWHTHPKGTPVGSVVDRGYLLNNPQLKKTRIIPYNKSAFTFDLKSPYVNYNNKIVNP